MACFTHGVGGLLTIAKGINPAIDESRVYDCMHQGGDYSFNTEALTMLLQQELVAIAHREGYMLPRS